MKRRDLIRLGATLSAGAATGIVPSFDPGGHGGRGAGSDPAPSGSDAARGIRARNIIFLAYDGTGYEDLATANFFARSMGRAPLHFENLMGRGRVGVVRPESLLSVITDSAAASSAWSTGRRIVNGAISQYPDGSDLTTIMELAKGRGMATGLATSTRITHATPADWMAATGDSCCRSRPVGSIMPTITMIRQG